jgi:hypothetical protein
MKNFKLFSLSPAMCVFLVACGGGGGGGGEGGEPYPVADSTAPVITIIGSETVNHEQGETYTDEGATAQDAVDGSVAVSTSGSVDTEAGTYTITYSATDSAGNTATATRTVIVADTIAPTIALNGSATVTHEQGTIYADQGASATDSVDTAVEVVTTGAINTAIAGEYTLTYTATDQAGNASSVTRTVVVSDTTIPVVSLIGPATIAHEQGTNYSDPGATAMDSVDGSITVVVTGSVGTGAGSYVLTYSATDSAGNGASASRTVIVGDTMAPVITLSGDAEVTHEQGTNFTDEGATALDTVDGTISVTVTGSVDEGTAGTYILTYTVTDSAGNTAVITRSVTVVDSSVDEMYLVGAATEYHEQGTEYVDEGVVATDGVDGVLEVVITGSVDIDTAGTYTLTFTATDNAGNERVLTRTVIVSDTTSPDISFGLTSELEGPADDNGRLVMDAETRNYILSLLTAVDSVDGSVAITTDLIAVGSAYPIGASTITVTATDSAGNVAEFVITITVVDEDGPVITAPSDISVISSDGLSVALTNSDVAAFLSGASADDNVDGVLVVSSDAPSGGFPLGTTTVTFTAVDAAGNTTTSSAVVTIVNGNITRAGFKLPTAITVLETVE